MAPFIFYKPTYTDRRYVMSKQYNSFNSHSLLIELAQELEQLNKVLSNSKARAKQPDADLGDSDCVHYDRDMHQFCLEKIIKVVQKIVKKEHPHTRALRILFNKDYEEKMDARSTRIFNRDPQMREMIRLTRKLKSSGF